MKNLLTIYSLFISATLFGQYPLAKKTYQQYNPDNAEWKSNTIETWQYDSNEREIQMTWWNEYQGPFQSHNNRRVETFYLPNGQLDLIKNHAWGDTLSIEGLTQFIYNNQEELIEIQENHNYTPGNSYFKKETFERNAAENSLTMKSYNSYGAPDNWVLDHQRDSFFNANGDLIKQTILNFKETGELLNERWWTYEFSQDNKLLQEGFWVQDENTDSMFLLSRQIYSYSNTGNETAVLYEKLITNIDEWRPQNKSITRLDEEGRMIYHFFENYGNSLNDTTEWHYSYTDKGEPFVYKEFTTIHFQSDQSLYQVRLDSFFYEYNDQDLLISKRKFSKYYDNPFIINTTFYEYYCNDFLKSEFFENLPQTSRILYEYHGQADCNLIEEQPDIKIFPNPNNGYLSVESNLLATKNVEIQIYNITGQQVFREKLDFIALRTDIHLPTLTPGSYIVVIKNDATNISKQLIIH